MSSEQWPVPMRPLSAVELLDIWEQGLSTPLAARAVLLLAAACPEHPSDALARLPIGQRDALLLRLRAWTFGPRLASVVDCPDCGERLELSLDSGELLTLNDGPPQETLSLLADGYALTFRLPNTLDLVALQDSAAAAAQRELLLERCLVEASRQPEASQEPAVPAGVLAAHLPEQVVAAMLEQMAAADPLGDIELAVACPACDYRWSAQFDIVSFFWREIDDWARRTLREVHVLARAYGWSERDTLDLSAWRRRTYLEMVL